MTVFWHKLGRWWSRHLEPNGNTTAENAQRQLLFKRELSWLDIIWCLIRIITPATLPDSFPSIFIDRDVVFVYWNCSLSFDIPNNSSAFHLEDGSLRSDKSEKDRYINGNTCVMVFCDALIRALLGNCRNAIYHFGQYKCINKALEIMRRVLQVPEVWSQKNSNWCKLNAAGLSTWICLYVSIW